MTHPDDVVKMLSELARAHGYGITQIELQNMEGAMGQSLPQYSYALEFIETVGTNGNVRAAG